VLAEPDPVVDDEDHDAPREGGAQCPRARLEAGDEAEDVVEQHREEHRHDEGQIRQPLGAHHVEHDVVADELDAPLADVAKSLGHERHLARRQQEEQRGQDDGDDQEQRVVGQHDRVLRKLPAVCGGRTEHGERVQLLEQSRYCGTQVLHGAGYLL
jgi:hypothetical protein